MTPSQIEKIVAELAERFDIPGVGCSVQQGDERADVAAGWANPQAGWAVTPETTFQIGSVTKMVTAMTVMACVEQGRVSLEDRVVGVLPELRYAVDGRFGEVSVAQLLQHTSGIEAQYWTDLGRGDEARRLTACAVADLPLIHAPGEIFSYTNNGYVLAAYLVERLLGRTWEQVVREWIAEPLDVALPVLPEDALLTASALGQIKVAGVPGTRPALRWATARGLSSGGGITVSAGDLAKVVRAYAGLELSDAPRILAAETTRAMRERIVDVPGWRFRAWGLGHAVHPTEDGREMIGHDGQSPSQTASVRVVPAEDLAVAVCCNAQWGSAFAELAAEELVAEATGVRRVRATMAESSSSTADPGASGRFRRLNTTLDLRSDGDRLLVTETGSASDQYAFFGIRETTPEVHRYELRAVGGGDFLADDGHELHLLDPDESGRATRIHDGFRLAVRSGS